MHAFALVGEAAARYRARMFAGDFGGGVLGSDDEVGTRVVFTGMTGADASST